MEKPTYDTLLGTLGGTLVLEDLIAALHGVACLMPSDGPVTPDNAHAWSLTRKDRDHITMLLRQLAKQFDGVHARLVHEQGRLLTALWTQLPEEERGPDRRMQEQVHRLYAELHGEGGTL